MTLLTRQASQEGRLGRGTVHHVAFRVPDEETQLALREAVAALGFNVTPVLDRNDFRSIYFREPGGVPFEFATDPPGFAVDENPEHLGEVPKLPPWLETRRDRLEEVLPQLRVPDRRERMRSDLGFTHRFVPGEDESGPTVLLLHGTGGNEEDSSRSEKRCPWVAYSPPRQGLRVRRPTFLPAPGRRSLRPRGPLFRTHELAEFWSRLRGVRFDRSKLVAVGYSNGANVAASTILLHPGLLRAAVLFKAMVPSSPM